MAEPITSNVSTNPNTTHVPPHLSVSDALSYLDAIKDRYRNQVEVYSRFLDVMKEFKLQTMDVLDVIECVSRLFIDNPDLIEGFNTFLPSGFRIQASTPQPDHPVIELIVQNAASSIQRIPVELSEEETRRLNTALSSPAVVHSNPPNSNTTGNTVNGNSYSDVTSTRINDAVQYISSVKDRFENGDGRNGNSIYKQFLEMMGRFHKGEIDMAEVHEEVQILFRNAPDLLDGFQTFWDATINMGTSANISTSTITVPSTA